MAARAARAMRKLAVATVMGLIILLLVGTLLPAGASPGQGWEYSGPPGYEKVTLK